MTVVAGNQGHVFKPGETPKGAHVVHAAKPGEKGQPIIGGGNNGMVENKDGGGSYGQTFNKLDIKS